MSTIYNGGPAFPVTNPQFIYKAGGDAAKAGLSVDERDRLYMEATEQAASGMSLRDYLAAQAMQGICSHPDTWGSPIPQIASLSYEMADAMLRARGSA